VLPHSERPVYVPPLRPLNPATQGAASPTPQILRGRGPVALPITRRPPPSVAPASPAPVVLSGGANPILVANNVNPDRGISSAADSLPTPTVVEQLDDSSDGSSAGDSSGGLTQFAFLAGAVFVAWLALKGS